MIIDFHTHVGDLRAPGDDKHAPITFESLLRRLDEEGIDRAVVLAVGASPESTKGPGLFDGSTDVVGQIRAGAAYKDRIFMFGNLDPRMGCLGNLDAERSRTLRAPTSPGCWRSSRRSAAAASAR